MHSSADTLARREIERRIIEEGTAIWKMKRKYETLMAEEDKRQQWEMLCNYNPWGKPGHGAPMPGAVRKTKWVFEDPNEEINPHSVTTLGRPGHGAPLRTATGQPQAYVRADPLIRFQKHDLARGAVENDLRYKSTPHDKENYKKELDAIICQKKKKKTDVTDNSVAQHGTDGQKGWTNDFMFKKLDKQLKNEREQVYEITGGGVELVPLLAKHRMVARCPLTTTDITKMSRICSEFTRAATSTAPEYIRQLCSQIKEKEKQKLQEQRDEVVQSHKHFETWQGFWGRPGHGAPKALSQREKLEALLYRLPSRRTTCRAVATSKQQE